MKTKVIAIEGIDGSGKTVQFDLLERKLLASGYSVTKRSYPAYGSFFGSRIGELLSGEAGLKATDIDQKSMALWFALDRFDDLKKFTDGEYDFMIINRYVLSNAVYQSIRDVDIDKPDIVDWVFELEYERLELPKPDLTLIFDLELNCANSNVDKKGFRDYVGMGKDVYESSTSIQRRSKEKYIEIASKHDNIVLVSCTNDGVMLTPEEISSQVFEIMRSHGLIH